MKQKNPTLDKKICRTTNFF